MNEEKNPAVSEKELEAIGRFSRRKLTAEEQGEEEKDYAVHKQVDLVFGAQIYI